MDGAAQAISGLRRKAVLAALALHPREVVGTKRLIDIVWGQSPPATAENTLQSHVSYLRRVLAGRATIVTRSPGYLLDLPDDAIDAAAARRLIRDAIGSVAKDAAALRTALEMWRGTSLADVRDVTWMRDQAEHLENLRLEAVEALVDIRLDLGEQAELVTELQALIELHPYRERLHGQLITALYRVGRQTDALAAYRRLRELLADEMGIDPSPALRDLETAILRQDAVLDAPNVSTTRPAAPPPAQLPLSVSAFSGRARELAQLDATLAGAEPETVTITALSGTAGVGKTALAVHWAHRVAAQFPDGQLYVNLRGVAPSGSVMDPGEALRGFLDAFGVAADRNPPGLEARSKLFRSVLTGKRVLIVLDNARDAEQVRPLLPGSPGSMVLVTSRSQLPGLVAAQGARPLGIELLSAAEARTMLAQRLGKERVAAEPGSVDDIIARCARLPLALAIAAACAATQPDLSLAAIAGQLDDEAAPLDPFDNSDPATDIRSVFSWSYRTLSVAVARLFRLLGVCPGPDISLAAAASACELPTREVRPLIANLVREQLLTETAPGRYTFHDLLRAYTVELSQVHDTDQERSAAVRRLLDHYLHSAYAAATQIAPQRDSITIAPTQAGVTVETFGSHHEAMTWFATNRSALMAAIAHSRDSSADHIWKLAWTLNTFFERNGSWSDLEAVHTAGLNAALRIQDKRGQAYAHRGIGIGQVRLRKWIDGLDHHVKAQALFEEIGDEYAAARSQLSIGAISGGQGRYHEELTEAIPALRRLADLGNRRGQAYALNNIGWCHAQLGDLDEALAACERAITLFEEVGDRSGLAASLDSLGYVQFHLGAPDQAIDCYETAITIYQDIGDLYNEADTFAYLGDGLEYAGDPDGARRAWKSAAALYEQQHHPAAAELRGKIAAGGI